MSWVFFKRYWHHDHRTTYDILERHDLHHHRPLYDPVVYHLHRHPHLDINRTDGDGFLHPHPRTPL